MTTLMTILFQLTKYTGNNLESLLRLSIDKILNQHKLLQEHIEKENEEQQGDSSSMPNMGSISSSMSSMSSGFSSGFSMPSL